MSLRLVGDIYVHEDNVPSVNYIRNMKNEGDEFAIGVYRNDFQKETLVRHIPRNITKFVIQILKASKFETFLQSERKEIKQRCWIWLRNSYNPHV